jgi:hypothetical protein
MRYAEVLGDRAQTSPTCQLECRPLADHLDFIQPSCKHQVWSQGMLRPHTEQGPLLEGSRHQVQSSAGCGLTGKRGMTPVVRKLRFADCELGIDLQGFAAGVSGVRLDERVIDPLLLQPGQQEMT